MPADYNIPMTDAQITEALQLMVERVSEGWAQETYDGSPVGSGSPYYHRSSKWWETQPADAAARAEAAVPAGTAGAVFFDRTQTLTAAQQEQARQNIKAGGSNRNLLDNPFFRINQRGGSSYSNGYSVDRWPVYNVTATIGDMDNGGAINLHYTGNGAGIFQKIPYDASLISKQFTLSVMFDDGDIFSATLNMPSTGVTISSIYRNVKLGLATTGTYHQFTIYIQTTDTDPSIKAAKLELGSVSTLANDAPPIYAEELAKCQRYFIRLDGSPTIGGCYTTTNTRFAASFPLPVTMRATPTLSGSGSYTIRSTAGDLVASAISVDGITPNAVKLLFTTTAATARLAGMALINGYIDLSADL